MRIAVTGVAAWTAAGDLDALAALVDADGRAFTDTPPYPTDGLSTPLAGCIPDLERDRPAETLLLEVVCQALGEAGPCEGRTGLVVGTSSGNVCGPWERWHRAVLAGEPADEAGTGRDAPTHAVARALGLDGPTATLSVACVSGTAVLAVAEAWLHEGRCERVVAAGVDAVSLFVHAGFSGLGALTRSLPRPFEDDRDGLLLGEGAAALVLEPATEGSRIFLAGTGLSADAVHMTAPDRHAGGAMRALRSAMERAGTGPDDIHTVSVHGTGTPFNDAMEAIALDGVFGRPMPKQLVKRAIGHTMGAAGAIEAALAVASLRERPGAIASMSSAFGGMNACAVLSTVPGPPVPRHEVRADAPVHSDGDLSRAWPDAPIAAKRGNATVRAALATLHDLVAVSGPLPTGTALVLSTRTGCRATDLRYHERLVAEGAGSVSRLQFTYTVPAAPICEASIQLGLQGPLLALLGSPDDGEQLAADLVRHGHAPVAIAVDVEEGATRFAARQFRRG
ncbi:MAG: beta-ketoacyl synthase N-terminal-like domain-containing protein [Myxococcota bacterium]